MAPAARRERAGPAAARGDVASVFAARVAGRDGHGSCSDTWNKFASEDPLDLRARANGHRRWDQVRALVGGAARIKTRAARQGAVSRRFVALTTEKLEEWMSRRSARSTSWTIHIDGIRRGAHRPQRSGVDATGSKHVSGLVIDGSRDFRSVCSVGKAFSCNVSGSQSP